MLATVKIAEAGLTIPALSGSFDMAVKYEIYKVDRSYWYLYEVSSSEIVCAACFSSVKAPLRFYIDAHSNAFVHEECQGLIYEL